LEWDRKYPPEGPNGADFYKLASIRTALVNLVGLQFYRHVILEWTTYSPIIATEDTMFVEGCKPHFCPDDQVTTIVQGRKITVCVYHVLEPRSSDVFSRPSERLWYLQGAALPAVERDPDDNDGCMLFWSMDDLNEKLQHARTLVEQY
jgi:hypothetical protein